MDALNFNSHPELSSSIMVAAWRGWPNSAGVASTSMSELLKQFATGRVASIDYETFAAFTDTRPVVREVGNQRQVEMPSGRFYYRKAEPLEKHDLVLFLGDEPDLRWHQYCDLFTEVASVCDTQLLITIGSMLDYVPHSIDPVVSSFTSGKLPAQFAHLRSQKSSYEGPVAISSVVEERFLKVNIPTISLWGHSPHYIPFDYNPGLTATVMQRLAGLLDLKLSTKAVDKRMAGYAADLNEHIESEKMQGYVARLEEWYGKSREEDVVQQVEDFLRTHEEE